LRTVFGSEFPTVGAEHRKARFVNVRRERLTQRRKVRVSQAVTRSQLQNTSAGHARTHVRTDERTSRKHYASVWAMEA